MVEEERSRFEKWAEPRFSATERHRYEDGRYYGINVYSAWLAWLAALEDRQEAAHKIRPAVGEEIRDCCGDRYACNVDSVCSCGYAGCRSHINTHLRYYASGGVSSEATPTKENAPKFTNRHGKPCSQACYEGRHAECTETFVTCNCTFRGSHTTVHAYATFTEKSAPAPEVQGTPTIEESIKAQIAEIAAHPASGLFQQNAPVGTPQKETPPKQCTWVDRMDFTGGIQCNFQRGHKGRHSFEKAATVPEEVQGKEPQTPTAQELAKGYCADMIATLQANVREGKNERAPLNSEIELHNAYVSGEAAGRRSAITENTDLLDALKLLIRALGGLDHTSGSVHLAVLNGEKVLAKCAELQEKAK